MRILTYICERLEKLIENYLKRYLSKNLRLNISLCISDPPVDFPVNHRDVPVAHSMTRNQPFVENMTGNHAKRGDVLVGQRHATPR